MAPRLAISGAAVAAVVAAVLAVSSGTDDTSSAFAVEPQGEGNVRVEISSLSDAEGLEKALGEAGIKADVKYLAVGMACKEPRFTPSAQPQKRGVRVGIDDSPDDTTFTINRSAIGAGDTLLVTASPATGQMVGQQVDVEVAEGAVSPCEPVAAPELLPGAPTESSGGPEGPSLESGAGPEGPGLHQRFDNK